MDQTRTAGGAVNSQSVSLMLSGAIGATVAIVHGVLVERMMVRPLAAVADRERLMSRPMRRLLPALTHASTFAWFAGGLSLIIAANWLDYAAARALSLLVGSLFLYGAVFNCWATRGRHPGWMLMAVAVGLIAFAATRTGA